MRRQEISKDTDLNHSINHDRKPQQNQGRCSFQVCTEHSQRPHSGPWNKSRWNDPSRTQCILCPHGIQWEINHRKIFGKPPNTWKENDTILNNCGSKKKREMRRFISQWMKMQTRTLEVTGCRGNSARGNTYNTKRLQHRRWRAQINTNQSPPRPPEEKGNWRAN